LTGEIEVTGTQRRFVSYLIKAVYYESEKNGNWLHEHCLPGEEKLEKYIL
jgi:hypothetical protein